MPSVEKVQRNRNLLKLWLSGEYTHSQLAERFQICNATVNATITKHYGKGKPQYNNLESEMRNDRTVRILYENWRGEVGWRNIIPERMYFGATSYHPVDQWLLEAHDVDKNAQRTFAMKDIHKWEEVAQ